MKLKNKTQYRGLTTGPHMSVGGPAPSSLPFPRHGRRAARPTRGSGVPRRRSSPVWNGERVGEGEGLAGKLTAGSVWAEGGRRGKIDERGRSSGERQWRPAMAGPIPAGFGRGRAREWVEEGKGEAREVRARRIRAGRRGTAGGASDGALLVLCSRELEEGKGREERRSF